ncbi:MAG: M20/M25/M40 family metallo-hydrolase, partial [Saprospiraceae bacterium]|nr:M20/M25/M40 family metallo-hydrolase [Saprospiraceae bacterium]
MNERTEDALQLLTDLIRIPSFSKKEDKTAQIIGTFLVKKGVKFERSNNNLISRNKFFDESRSTVVLNSHHDTVKVVDGWTRDPFGAEVENEKLFGLGSNDAGGCLVSLIATYIFFYDKPLDYNLILIASAEEENFGKNGVSSVLSKLEIEPDLGIIGEPTQMQMAVAEKGLIVIDGLAKGESGHVAYQKGENAIYKAMDDIK